MKLVNLALTALALAAGGAANAAIVYSETGPTGELISPNSFTRLFNAGAGAGLATFQLNGYRTLDGNQQGVQDNFVLNINSVDVLIGTFQLGGLGGNVVFFQPLGTIISTANFGFNEGGAALFSVPITLVAGSNSLVFRYSGVFEGLDNEAWDVQDIVVTGNPVPEPATWALMVAGFGLVGASMRRRTRATVAA